MRTLRYVSKKPMTDYASALEWLLPLALAKRDGAFGGFEAVATGEEAVVRDHEVAKLSINYIVSKSILLRKHHGAQRNGLELLDLSSSCRRSLAAMEPTTLQKCSPRRSTKKDKDDSKFSIAFSYVCIRKLTHRDFRGPNNFPPAHR